MTSPPGSWSNRLSELFVRHLWLQVRAELGESFLLYQRRRIKLPVSHAAHDEPDVSNMSMNGSGVFPLPVTQR